MLGIFEISRFKNYNICSFKQYSLGGLNRTALLRENVIFFFFWGGGINITINNTSLFTIVYAIPELSSSPILWFQSKINNKKKKSDTFLSYYFLIYFQGFFSLLSCRFFTFWTYVCWCYVFKQHCILGSDTFRLIFFLVSFRLSNISSRNISSNTFCLSYISSK